MTYEDQGIWFVLLLHMHGSAQRGKLRLNDRPMTIEEISELLKLNQAKVEQTVSKLLSKGVASMEPDGTIINRRMVRDDKIRNLRTEAGRAGGKQTASKLQANRKQKSTPSVSSSSSSSSSSSKTKTTFAGSSPAGDGASPGKKVQTNDHQRFVDHVLTTYKSQYQSKYPFGAEDGRIVRWCLQNWTAPECMALWDQFISRRWDFEKDGKLVKIPHALRHFQSKIRILLEESGWKSVVKKYDQHSVPDNPLSGLELKSSTDTE